MDDSQADRFSCSPLWQLQRAYFEAAGPVAWRNAIVPQYVTSNPFIAASYARVVEGFLRDWQAAPEGAADEPFHIVELGAGSGRFAFLFLRALTARLARPGAPKVRVRYVMTDFAEANIAFWSAHPALRPFVEAGVLDFARFDAGADRALHLRESGRTLGPGSLARPLVVLANYFFDGIPYDAFAVEDGSLAESRVRLSWPDGAAHTLEDVELDYELHPAPDAPYGDAELDRIVTGYRERLANATVPFPIAGLRLCRALAELSGDRLLLLSADKGYLDAAELEGLPPQQLAHHGSFSVTVNYHAIGEWFRGRGGQVFAADGDHTVLAVLGFALGAPAGGLAATASAYADAVDGFGPDEFFRVKKCVERQWTASTLPELLAILRLSRGDARLFELAFQALVERARCASPRESAAIAAAVAETWDGYYHLGEAFDLAFHLGVLLFEIGRPRDAIGFFEHSLALYGAHPDTCFNLVFCQLELGDLDSARRRAAQTLALDPAHAAARELLENLGAAVIACEAA